VWAKSTRIACQSVAVLMVTIMEVVVGQVLAMMQRVKPLPHMLCTPREPSAWLRQCRKLLQKLRRRLQNPWTPA
jgi:hypothetical protein